MEPQQDAILNTAPFADQTVAAAQSSAIQPPQPSADKQSLPPDCLHIESLDMEARGVAHANGKVIFVEGALPGEVVSFETLRRKKNYEIAKTTQVLRDSPLRVTPRCPHFEQCGGCSMQHLDMPGQMAIKQRVLEDNLVHLGKVKPAFILRPMHGLTWGYRFRGRLSVRHVPSKGGILIGFHERQSSYVCDMKSCDILPSHLSALLMPLRELITDLSLYDRLPQIEFAVGEHDGTTVTALVLRILAPLNARDEAQIRTFADRYSVQIWLQPDTPATAFLFYPSNVGLSYTLPEFKVVMPFKPVDFTQVNHAVNRSLISRALRLLALRPHERALDLFCGLGNFTLPMARQAAQVLGLEGSASLIERAKQNAQHNGLADKVRYGVRNLFDIQPDDLLALGKFDKYLIDPPREGALAVVKAMAALSHRDDPTQVASLPSRLVYVSCNPATLARDAGILVHEGGWRLTQTGVVNMFPHTSHVESIAVFERS